MYEIFTNSQKLYGLKMAFTEATTEGCKGSLYKNTKKRENSWGQKIGFHKKIISIFFSDHTIERG